MGALVVAVLVGTFARAAGSAPSATVVTQTFTPVADAYVSSSKPKTNYGKATRLKTDESPVLATFVRFNLVNLAGPVTQATLRVYARTSSSAGFDLRAVSDNTWGENTITYANAPPYSTTSYGLDAPVSGGSWTNVDVTPLITGNGLVSLALLTPSTTELDVDSRQGTKKPQLIVQTGVADTSPPTAPVGLAVTGGPSSLGLSWTPSTDNTGVAGYDLWLNKVNVGSTSSTSYAFSGLSCGTTYVLGVDAFDAAGNISTRTSVSATTSACQDTQPPSAPTLLVASNIAPSSLTLSWQASTDDTGVAGYDVFLNGSKVGSTATPAYSFGGLACATTYTLGVEAYDAAGNRSTRSSIGAATGACPDLQPPSAPTSLAISNSSATSLTLSWQASTDDTGVVGYDVFLNGVKLASTSSTSYAFSGLSCGTSYTLAVDAFDAAGNVSTRSSLSRTTSACPDTQAPSAPTLLSVSSVTATALTLSWQPSTDDTGVAGYDVFLNGSKVGSTTVTTVYSFGGLQCGTSYTLGVEAFDAAGNRSTRSTVTTATTACPDTQAPSAPTNLAATGATQSSVGVSWTASTDNVLVAGYDLYSNGTKVGTTTGTSYTFSGLACGTTYTFGVEAFDAAGNRSTRSSVSGATSACPDTQAPSTPTGLSLSGVGQTSIGLSWTASTDNVGVVGYDLYSNGTKVGSTAGTSYTFGGLQCGTSYTLGVAAFDAAGNRSTSASVTGNTGACSTKTPAPVFRYAYFGDSDPTANKNLGATVIDVGSKSSADSLPTGLQGLVWVGDYNNSSCSWDVSDSSLSSIVSAGKGDPKIYGWMMSDEPNPVACPNAPSQHKARSALIHSIDPNTKTFFTMDSNGFSGNLTQDAIDQIPQWVGTADLVGLDPYPCLVNKACNYTFISNMIAKADASGLPYVGILQAFDGTGAGESFRLPTATELQNMVNLWAASHETGSGYFAWDWPAANWYLNAHPDLESVIQNFYTGSGTTDTTAPSAPAGLTATGATATSVSLSWTASTDNVGVTGYNVYNGTTPAGTTTSTTYTVGSLPCGTSSTFGVEAKDAAGNVSSRTTLTASTSACVAAPTSSALPSISGSAIVNTLLTASTGTWTNSPSSYAYQWRRCDTSGANCAAILGANGQVYTVASADQGAALRVDVTASNASGSATATSAPTAVVQGATSDPVIVAAGDICGSPSDCTPTANLIAAVNPTAVLTLGDNAYETGSASDFASNYDPNWGKYKAITKPAPGNHEYDYGNQLTGYFAYFGNPPAYYSYDIGSWHLISLNGELSASAGSAQETWLKNDLAAHTNMCTLAYWHEPRWSSGYHGGSSYYGTFWTDLYSAGADVVLNGHDHDYERFAPQDPNGNLDTAKGIREFVSGTGGDSHYTFNAPTANSEVRDSTSFGVLKLTLHATSYDWKFVPISGASFTDSGSGNCH